jgi:hypothetical protein
VGKPRKRWIDTVEEDTKKLMGIRNWKRTAQDREEWRGLIREARPDIGLLCHRRRRR